MSKKTTAYSRTRKSIQNYINYTERAYNIKIQIPHIPTEKELRARGITGTALTKKTNELKKIRATMSQRVAQGYGRRGSVESFKKEARRISKAVTEAYSAPVDTGGNAYQRYLGLVKDLSAEPTSTDRGYMKDAQIIATAKGWAQRVLAVLTEKAEEVGQEAVGYAIANMSKADYERATLWIMVYSNVEYMAVGAELLITQIRTAVKLSDDDMQTLADEAAGAMSENDLEELMKTQTERIAKGTI